MVNATLQANGIDHTKRYIRITGGVAKPGFYPLRPSTSTLLGALSEADCFSWHKHSLLEIHRVDGSVELYDCKKIEIGSTNDPCIYPNDHIHVPRKNLVGY